MQIYPNIYWLRFNACSWKFAIIHAEKESFLLQSGEWKIPRSSLFFLRKAIGKAKLNRKFIKMKKLEQSLKID